MLYYNIIHALYYTVLNFTIVAYYYTFVHRHRSPARPPRPRRRAAPGRRPPPRPGPPGGGKLL